MLSHLACARPIAATALLRRLSSAALVGKSVPPFYGYTIDMSQYLGASGPLIEQRLLVVRGLLSKKGA